MHHAKIYFSFRTPGDSAAQRGAVLWEPPDPAFAEVKNCVVDHLAGCGIAAREIIRPEIFKHPLSFDFLPGFTPGSLHLIFKPLEYIRPLKGARNIWVMAAGPPNLSPERKVLFVNPIRMLSLVDEIWVPSEAQRRWVERQDGSRPILMLSREAGGKISPDPILERIAALANQP